MKRSGPLKRYKQLQPGEKSLAWGKKRKRLNARSQKRQKQYDEYNPEREQFLKDNPICQVPDCDRASTDVHHMKKRNGVRLLDKSKWMATCRLCNNRAEDDPKWALENGYKLHVNRESATVPLDQKMPLALGQTPSAREHSPTTPASPWTDPDTPTPGEE